MMRNWEGEEAGKGAPQYPHQVGCALRWKSMAKAKNNSDAGIGALEEDFLSGNGLYFHAHLLQA